MDDSRHGRNVSLETGVNVGESSLQSVIESARAVREQAHAPYSGFVVGAALESREGEVFVGCNVENASLGLTVCAERVAIGAAVAGGSRGWRRLVVVADGRGQSVAPCGACRQVLAEFCEDLEIVLANQDEVLETLRLRDLLPHRFDGASWDR